MENDNLEKVNNDNSEYEYIHDYKHLVGSTIFEYVGYILRFCPKDKFENMKVFWQNIEKSLSNIEYKTSKVTKINDWFSFDANLGDIVLNFSLQDVDCEYIFLVQESSTFDRI